MTIENSPAWSPQEEQPDDYERAVSPDEVQRLGRTSLSSGDYRGLSAPVIDLEAQGIEPPHYAPAGAEVYEGSATKGLNILDDTAQERVAADYLHSLFPDSSFSYLGSGRYGVVLADEEGRAYKIYRSALSYSRYEREAGALQLLADAGIAPKLHLFVDAGKEYRLDRSTFDYTESGFGDVQIPRQDSGKELPVMVMDKVDAGPLEEAEPQKFVDGFCRVAEIFLRENIHSWDSEFMVNKATGEVIILDVGELSQKPFDAASATPKAIRDNEEEILSGIILDFGLMGDQDRILDAYEGGGLEAVREYLTQHVAA